MTGGAFSYATGGYELGKVIGGKLLETIGCCNELFFRMMIRIWFWVVCWTNIYFILKNCRNVLMKIFLLLMRQKVSHCILLKHFIIILWGMFSVLYMSGIIKRISNYFRVVNKIRWLAIRTSVTNGAYNCYRNVSFPLSFKHFLSFFFIVCTARVFFYWWYSQRNTKSFRTICLLFIFEIS